MPIYEYRCKKCGSTFEEIIQGDRNREIPCPRCGNQSTEKIISVIGGIAMGKSSGSYCNSQCPGISNCASAGHGCCQHTD
jgi:putative FmdB family regulatory protein